MKEEGPLSDCDVIFRQLQLVVIYRYIVDSGLRMTSPPVFRSRQDKTMMASRGWTAFGISSGQRLGLDFEPS